MEVTLADVMQIDPLTYELPKDYTPRDVEILWWLFRRERWVKEDLKLARFEIKTLNEELSKLKRSKVTEIAKPLQKKVRFEDLIKQLLKIHLAENSLVEFDEGSIPVIQKAKVAELAQRCGEMIILLTTYLERRGVDEAGRRELFNTLKKEDWSKCL